MGAKGSNWNIYHFSAKLHRCILQDTEIFEVREYAWENGRCILSEQFLGIILLYEQTDCIEKRGVKII